MNDRILLVAAMLLLFGPFAGAVQKEAGKAVRSGDFVYLQMPRALGNLVRSPGWSEGAPESVASVGAFKISPMRSLIRSPANILTAVDAEGQTREVQATQDEVELLRDMGAKQAGKYGYALKRFLRLKLENPGASITIEADGEKYDFDISPTP